jgi:hypothetical protein
MSEGMSGGTYPNRKWPKDEIQRQGLQIGAEILYERWQEALKLERELRDDLRRTRSALQQIRDFVLLNYREGDNEFQIAILAVTALDETQEPDSTEPTQ